MDIIGSSGISPSKVNPFHIGKGLIGVGKEGKPLFESTPSK